MADERYLQAREWERNKWRLRQYNLRLKGLPPTFASSDRKVRASLCEMIQRASTVPLLGVHTTENCLCGKGRYAHALIYVGMRRMATCSYKTWPTQKLTGYA